MNSRGKILQGKWGYSVSFIIISIIVTTGYMLQYLLGPVNLEPFKWPGNLIILLASILIIALGSRFGKATRIIRWISGSPALISAFTFFTIQALMLGLFPQAHLQNIESYNQLGFNSVATSYPYILTQIYTLFVLGFNLIGVLQKKNKDLSFMIILGGFWIALVSAQLGAFDVKKTSVYLYETGSAEYGKGANGDIVPLGFKITLKDFHMEEYPPEVLIIDPSAETKGKGLIKERLEVKVGESVSLDGWAFKIDKYYPFAQKDSLAFIKSNKEGSLRAVKIIAENLKTDEKLSGWLSRGSRRKSAPGLKINNSLALYFEKPKPRRYVSSLLIDGKENEIKVEVNRPRSINGWKIYQKGYDKEDGRWSKGSTLELVKDPWLPAVYIGIYIMIFGAVTRLFRKVRSERGDI